MIDSKLYQFLRMRLAGKGWLDSCRLVVTSLSMFWPRMSVHWIPNCQCLSERSQLGCWVIIWVQAFLVCLSESSEDCQRQLFSPPDELCTCRAAFFFTRYWRRTCTGGTSTWKWPRFIFTREAKPAEKKKQKHNKRSCKTRWRVTWLTFSPYPLSPSWRVKLNLHFKVAGVDSVAEVDSVAQRSALTARGLSVEFPV